MVKNSTFASKSTFFKQNTSKSSKIPLMYWNTTEIHPKSTKIHPKSTQNLKIFPVIHFFFLKTCGNDRTHPAMSKSTLRSEKTATQKNIFPKHFPKKYTKKSFTKIQKKNPKKIFFSQNTKKSFTKIKKIPKKIHLHKKNFSKFQKKNPKK